jgi:hypothetical protein
MKYVREDLENLIFIEKLSYREIGRRYKVSDTYIKKICNRLGISLSKRKIFPKGFIPANKGRAKPRSKCLNCGNDCEIYAKKYCSIKCQQHLNSENAYKDFLKNNDKYCRATYNPKVFKQYFLKDQNNCCAICQMANEWNNKSIVFVLDHIDGNAANNKRENLRLVCPNCDSQLDTYKSKNKNSARKERYLKSYKN